MVGQVSARRAAGVILEMIKVLIYTIMAVKGFKMNSPVFRAGVTKNSKF